MELPPQNEDYREQSYWDKRYREEETFDWFSKYSAFRRLVHNCISKDNSILMLGCGNSELSADMYNDGYTNITNIDYSPVVIDNMKQRCQHMPTMKWQVMDIRALHYPEKSFDVVFEKGTLDALLVTETNPWKLSQEGTQLMDSILSEVSRVLKPNGTFISVTFAQPHFRQLIYARPKYNWNFQVQEFGTSFHFFFYIMRKGECLSADTIEKNNWYEALTVVTPGMDITHHDEDSEEFIFSIQS